MSSNGLITVVSKFSVGETLDRLTAAVTSAGLLVFTRINHARNAEEVGLELRPTELLIFGHPQGRHPLKQDKQTAGIDLPVKALAWKDEAGEVWLTYNRNRNVIGGNLLMLPVAAGALGMSFFVSLYVQNVLHYSPSLSGNSFLPVSLIIGTISLPAGCATR